MKLLTMTPIHVGSGETLNSLSYITHRNSLYVLDMDKFFAILSEVQREAYLQWMEPILNRMAELDGKIDQAKDNRERTQLKNQKRELGKQLSIDWFIENRLRQNPIDFLKKCLAYQLPFMFPPGRDGFRTLIKDGQNKVYIPGTEIKGTIRTSLLYSLLKDKTNYEILRESLNDFRSFFRSGASPKEKIKKLARIADAQFENGLERKLLRGREKDAKYDFLKLVNISDTNPVPLTHLQINTITVLGSTRNIRIWEETINPQMEFQFNFSVQERAFLDELKLQRLKDCLSVPKILEACYYRSKEILEEEKRYFGGEKYILELINNLQNENQAISPLLRLGAGQGFLGATIGLKVKQNDPELYNDAIREGVSFLRKWRTQRENFPKTRRVVIDGQGKAINLLGWVKLKE